MLKTYLLAGIPLISLFMISCVSVDLAPKDPERSSDVEFKEPSKPFEEESNPSLDNLWVNTKNANSISFLSECGSPDDPPLEQVLENITNGISGKKVLQQKELQYNSRRAIRSSFSGHVDGVPSNLDLLVFKKNNCLYVINYVSLPATREADLKQFERFLDAFKVK